MRCVPFVLMLAIAPAAALAQSRPSAGVESLACHAIRRGESATHAARRITGDGRNAYQTWFRIRNASSRTVPKSQYDRIRAGWRACVDKSVIARTTRKNARHLEALDASGASDAAESLALTHVLVASTMLTSAEAAAGGPQPVALDRLRVIGNIDLMMVWLGAALVVPWFGWRTLDGYLARRNAASIVMRQFADRFVTEFERPLVPSPATERPLNVQVRCRAWRRRLDILLAPGVGRRYPNLSDHKQNVEYDVARVLLVLADDSFVSGPLSAQREWVVVPFRFTAGSKQAGVACISSL